LASRSGLGNFFDAGYVFPITTIHCCDDELMMMMMTIIIITIIINFSPKE